MASRIHKSLFAILAISGIMLVGVFWYMTRGFGQIGQSQFGMVALSPSGGAPLYAHREVRGLNYDVVTLSPSSEFCSTPNLQTDYLLRYDGSPLYLSQHQGRTVVYRYGSIELPKAMQNNCGVAIEQLTFKEFQVLKQTYRSRGIERIDVPVAAGASLCR